MNGVSMNGVVKAIHNVTTVVMSLRTKLVNNVALKQSFSTFLFP